MASPSFTTHENDQPRDQFSSICNCLYRGTTQQHVNIKIANVLRADLLRGFCKNQSLAEQKSIGLRHVEAELDYLVITPLKLK